MRLVAASLLLIVFSIGAASVLRADEPSDVFYIAMRAPNLDPAPRFVSVSETATADQNLPIHACDGETYYATRGDASMVRAASVHKNIVELLGASAGTDPRRASVICIMPTSS